jgi:hypothetical protein
MTKTMTAAAAVLLLTTGLAWAHGDVKCDPPTPKAEWRPHSELAKKLTDEGWVIRQMKTTPSCYEVYAKTPDGKRVEAFFHPKTFERVE